MWLALAGGARAQRDGPIVHVSLPKGDQVARRETVSVSYDADPGTYVVVLRLDLDGNLSVLAPSRPNERSKFTGADEVRTVRFAADNALGTGTVVILGSRTPFDVRAYRDRSGAWVTTTTSSTATREDAVKRFASLTTRRGEAPTMDYVEYGVRTNPIAEPGVRVIDYGVRFDPCATGLYGSASAQWRCVGRPGSRPEPRRRD